ESSYDPSWVTGEVVRGYADSFGGDAGAVMDALQRMVGSQEPDSLRPQLARLRATVHLLVAVAVAPGTAAAIALLGSELASFRLDRIPESGLYIQEERPGVVVEAVGAMVRELAAARRHDSTERTLCVVDRYYGGRI